MTIIFLLFALQYKYDNVYNVSKLSSNINDRVQVLVCPVESCTVVHYSWKQA